MTKFSKGHNSGKIRWFFFFKFNQGIYSSSPVSWPNFKPLAQIVFELSCWQRTSIWGLTSQSTIFQSCRNGATASWVINQYFRGVKCLAQGHNTVAVGLEPPTSRSGVRHSTTEPPRSPGLLWLMRKFSLKLTEVEVEFSKDAEGIESSIYW